MFQLIQTTSRYSTFSVDSAQYFLGIDLFLQKFEYFEQKSMQLSFFCVFEKKTRCSYDPERDSMTHIK